MKKLTLLAALSAAALTVGAAGAASAQPWGHGGGWMSVNERQARLDARIDAGVRRGEITRQEARRLRGEFYSLARLEHRYRRDGLSNGERYGYGYGDGYRH
jgi:hypothetical protein